jgi:hypothetical protein
LVAETLGAGRAVRWLDARLPSIHRRHTWGTLAFLGGALLFHAAWFLCPLWVLSWQPVGVALGMVGVAWAAGTRRLSLALGAVAFAATLAAPEVTIGGWLILTAAALANRSRPRLLALATAFAAYLVASALLDAEVLLTVLLMAAVTAVLAAQALPSTAKPSAPR